MTGDGPVRVWLVERTYGDDELNLVILTYATLDREWYYRKERALTSFTGPARETTAAVEVDPDDLGRTPSADREYYATAARRTAERYEPDEAI
jgi:hypothetical protein